MRTQGPAAIGTWLRALVNQRSVKSDVTLMAGSTALAQLVGFALTPVVSRAFKPEAFGWWALIFNAGALAASVGGLRLEMAIPVSETDDEAADLMRGSLVAVVGIACIAGLIVSVGPSTLVGSRGSGARAEAALAVAVVALLTGAGQVVSLWGIRISAFGSLASYRIVQGVLTIGSPLLLGAVFGFQKSDLFIGWAIGQIAALFTLRSAWAASGTAPELRRDTSRIAASARKFRHVSTSLVPYGVLETARERGMFFVVGLFGATEVGLFALALRLAWAPASFLSSSLSSVVFSRASSLGVAALELPVVSALRWLARLSTPGAVVLALTADAWAAPVLGSEWKQLSGFLSILVLPAWCVMNVSWLDRLWVASGQQAKLFRLTVVLSLFLALTIAAELLLHAGAQLIVASYALIFSVYMGVWTVSLFRACGFERIRLGAIAGETAIVASFFGAISLFARTTHMTIAWLLMFIALGGYYVAIGTAAIRRLALISDSHVQPR